MKFFRIFILALFCAMIITNGIIWFLWSSMEKTIMNRDYYNHLLSETELVPVIHDRIHLDLPNLLAENLSERALIEVELIIEDLAESGDRQSEETLKHVLEIYSDALIQAFKSSWLRDQAIDVLDVFFQNLDLNNGELDYSIDLTPNHLVLRQHLADGLAIKFALNDEEPDEKIEIIVNSLLTASSIPESYSLADAFSIAGIADGVDEFIVAIGSFRRIMIYWPYVIYVLIALLTIYLIGTGRALVFLGAITLLLSSFLWAFVLFGRLFFVGLEFFRVKVLFDSISAPLVEIIEYVGLHSFFLITPMLYWPSFVGLFILLAGIVLKLQYVDKV